MFYGKMCSTEVGYGYKSNKVSVGQKKRAWRIRREYENYFKIYGGSAYVAGDTPF